MASNSSDDSQATVMPLSAHTWFSLPYATVLLAIVFISLAVLSPRASERLFGLVEEFFSRLASYRILAIFFLFVLVVTLRLALLNQLPIPNPGIHDEFSYLLMGDTFARGRLANPTHPLWRSFETFHVLWFPTYASKYPPAQGLTLAVGQILGHPWIGVLLSAATMAAAFVWMLQAWIPARWAFLAGVLAAIRICVASYWINSYWGGAVAAIGGALVLGSFGRLRRKPLVLHGILLGFGVAILLNSRPYESVFFCIPIGIALLLLFLKTPDAKQRSAWSKAVLSTAVIVLITVSGMAFYNWRVAGNPLHPPFTQATRLQDRSAIFLWQAPKPPVHYGVAELDYFYNQSDVVRYDRTWSALWSAFQEKLQRCEAVFFWPACWFLLPGALWLYRDRRLRLILLALLATVFGYCLVVWPGPHYLAPAAGAWFALLAQSVRHLRAFRPFRRPIGAALSRVVLIALVFDVSDLVLRRIGDPRGWGGWGIYERAELRDALESTPGKHLVLVQYDPGHDVNEEWVFNSADIDASKIIWARDLPGERNDRLLAYYPDRTIWRVTVTPETDQVARLRVPLTRRTPDTKAVDLHKP